ncbi:hypothetical protein BCV69DRAFT_192366 [Microstroma glucosiphilum]|uniref:Peptidase S54 rhomboid domain-containing protein n=1 Tax=Pseudomicrostroma glucosiphilum TaxID=1684307 RepID=A0A316U7Y6_9BASI|nr:hypothetical protein BCV69DRAFT_192366 [Pseudomicrostroma glucosiphilum]PWN20561.1 hypothetical protein BCV69DRAFT_192366 [Pseudomicrostroma glucosiphilum]
MNGVGFVSNASSRGAFALLFPSTSSSSSSRLPAAAAAASTFFQTSNTTTRGHSTARIPSWTRRCDGQSDRSISSVTPSSLQQLIQAAKDAAVFSWPHYLQGTVDRAKPSLLAAANSISSLNCYSDVLSSHAVLSRPSRSTAPAAKGSLKKRAGGPTRPLLPSQPPRKKATPPAPPPSPRPEESQPPAPPPGNSASSSSRPPPPPSPPAEPRPYIPQPSQRTATQTWYHAPDTGPHSSSPGSLSWYISQIDRLPTPLLIYSLIALNLLIFFSWQYALTSSRTKQGDPTWPLFMMNNFVHSQRNWEEGRWWNLLTATFSHAIPQHLGMNMLSVALIAPALAMKVGSANFLGVYLLGGVAGSLASSLNFLWLEPKLQPNQILKRPRPEGGYSTLGASGSVFALLATLTFLDPRQRFMFFFIIPCSARILLGGMTLNELGGLYFGRDLLGQLFAGKTDHAAHLGGM